MPKTKQSLFPVYIVEGKSWELQTCSLELNQGEEVFIAFGFF